MTGARIALEQFEMTPKPGGSGLAMEINDGFGSGRDLRPAMDPGADLPPIGMSLDSPFADSGLPNLDNAMDEDGLPPMGR